MKENKIIFFNTGWMDFYRGISNDKITGGGKHIDKTGWGSEIFNFKNFENRLYGYVQPKIDSKHIKPSTIRLERLGGLKSDKKIDNLTVVWTATNPYKGGSYIIGWYHNATVYRFEQPPPVNSGREYQNITLNYYTTTESKRGKLLPVDERVIKVPRGKNGMGQSNVWYAENNTEFINIVKDYIFDGKLPDKYRKSSKGKGFPRQSDPFKRIKVEKTAIKFVTEHYEKLGYVVQSFEKDNVGWDLSARNDEIELKLEVKGLSGDSILSELTPNEFKNLNADKINYRLCIVINALTKPQLKIFAFSNDNNQWTSGDGTIINFEERTSARIYV